METVFFSVVVAVVIAAIVLGAMHSSHPVAPPVPQPDRAPDADTTEKEEKYREACAAYMQAKAERDAILNEYQECEPLLDGVARLFAYLFDMPVPVVLKRHENVDMLVMRGKELPLHLVERVEYNPGYAGTLIRPSEYSFGRGSGYGLYNNYLRPTDFPPDTFSTTHFWHLADPLSCLYHRQIPNLTVCMASGEKHELTCWNRHKLNEWHDDLVRAWKGAPVSDKAKALR